MVMPTNTRNSAPFAGTSRVGILAALLAITAIGRVQAQTRKFELGDVQKIVAVSSPAISPDGKSIAIIVTRVNWDDDRHDSLLVLVDIATGAQRKLTNIRKGLSSPQWSPTGDRLAFLAEAGEEKKAAEQIFVLPTNAGEPQRVKVDSLHMPDARVIEESYPHPFEPDERQGWKEYKDAGVHVEYHPRDAVAEVRGNVAWVTVTLPSNWRADTPAGRVMLGGSTWRATYEESFILVKTPAGWEIAFRHTTILPPDFGVEPDYQQEHGGMKLAKVPEDGPAGQAGLKSGDVLIEYGGQKIEDPDDLYRLRYAHYEGEKVMVAVMRGHEKITKEVTLEQMR